MLRRLDALQPQPVLRETKKIYDALLWQGRLQWGDRTPAMICARGDILESYGPYRESVAFCYLQNSGPGVHPHASNFHVGCLMTVFSNLSWT